MFVNSIILLFLLLAVIRGGREVIGLTVFGFFAILIVFFWIARKKTLGITRLTLPATLFLFWLLISTLSSLNPIIGLVHLFAIFVYFLIFQICIMLPKDDLIKKITFSYCLISLCLSVIVCIQFFLNWKMYIQKTILPCAHFPNPNLLAGFLSGSIILLINELVNRKKALKKSPRRHSELVSEHPREKNYILPRPWYVVYLSLALIPMIMAEIFTFSRGAWVGLIVGLIVLFTQPLCAKAGFQKIIRLAISMAIILLFCFIFIPKDYTTKWISYKFFSPVGRIVIWKTCINGFFAKPLTGWGLGSLDIVYNRFKVPANWEIGRYGRHTRFAHNEFLDLGVETGLIGLALFLWLIWLVLKETYHNKVFFAILTAILAHSFFDFNLHLPIIFYVVILMASTSIKVDKVIELKSKTRKLISFPLTFFLIITICSFCSELLKIKAIKNEQKNNKEKALTFYNLSTIFNPIDYIALWKKANLTQSEKIYKTAIKLSPHNSYIHYDLAKLYHRTGNTIEAFKEYQKAIEKNPKNPFFYFDLAELCVGQKLTSKGIFYYKKAMETEPYYLIAHYKLGILEKNNTHFTYISKILNMNITPTDTYTARLLYFPNELRKKLCIKDRK